MQAAYRWVHVLQPRLATGAGGDNEWEGRIKVIRQLVQGVDAKQDRLEQRVEAVQASLDQRMVSMQASMDSMARALEGLTAEV